MEDKQIAENGPSVVAAHGTETSPHPSLAREPGLCVVAVNVGLVVSFFEFGAVFGGGRGVPGASTITSIARLQFKDEQR